MIIKPKLVLINKVMVIYLLILGLLFYFLFSNLDDVGSILGYGLISLIFIVGFIVGFYSNYSFNKKAYYEIDKEKIVCKFAFGIERIIPIKKIKSIRVEKSLWGGFTKILAVKVEESVLSSYGWQPSTKKWDFMLTGLNEEQMKEIIDYVVKINPEASKANFKKNEYSEQLKNKIRRLVSIKIKVIVSLFLFLFIIFPTTLVLIKLFPITKDFLPFILFGIIFLDIGFFLYSESKVIKETGVYTNLISLSQLSQEKLIFRGESVKYIHITEKIAGIFLFSLGIIIFVIGLILGLINLF